MSIGLLLITHGAIGASLLATATRMLGGQCPTPTAVLAVTDETQRARIEVEAQRLTQELDQGEGVLVMTDLYGSTPANIACSLQGKTGAIRILAGLNLPMLVRALNYACLPLEELVLKAESGGRNGVLICTTQECATRGKGL